MRLALRVTAPLAVAACLTSGAAVAALRPHRASVIPPVAADTARIRATADSLRVAREGRVRDLDIAFYADRAARDPAGAADLARLAALYLQRSRETGDPGDAVRAERAARRSLRNRGARNEQAALVLASSLLAQHRFSEALGVAGRLSESAPDVAQFRALLGEIQLELGRYAEARATFRSVSRDARDLAVAPRLARWAELEGRPDEARRILALAVADARRSAHLPREQLAWYWLRLGDLDLRAGRIGDAEREYTEALRAHPDDYRVLAALARLEAARGRWAAAVEDGERSIGVALDPATLGTLSDAYAALGDSARAAEYARVLDVAVLRQPGAYHRAWSLFWLDHRRHVGRVYRKVREELRARRDVYGYDLLAWALYTQGRHADARRAMAAALAQGIQDAQLFYHAGMIERALGRDAAAREYLTRALRVNPYFDARHPAVARAVLDSLAGAGAAGE